MAITVSGLSPILVTVVSNTVTTNTTFPAGVPNDRSYLLGNDVVGLLPSGRWIAGFGLLLQNTGALNGIAMTNNGLIVTNEAVAALELVGNGGALSYGGTGTIINNSAAGGVGL